MSFEWRRLEGGAFAISWQEADGATVVHIDDSEAGRSLAFFTTADRQFHRLEGRCVPSMVAKTKEDVRRISNRRTRRRS